MYDLYCHTELNQHYYDVCRSLKDLPPLELRNLGGALGLSYATLTKMTDRDLPNEMVAAWLRREDYVLKRSGEPTRNTLASKLEEIGQTGLAEDIKSRKRCTYFREQIQSENPSTVTFEAPSKYACGSNSTSMHG